AGDVLSHFWAPLCAVGASGPAGPNAQICVSVFGASIVPERPRLLVSLSKTNYTEGLVRESGRLSVTLLSDSQADLLEPLGLRSGRDGNKLAGLEVELTGSGAPTFPGAVGALDCEVLEPLDLGDATAFLVAVRDRWGLGGEQPLPWAVAKTVVGEEFLMRWAEKSAREQEAARAVMSWQD
ncbi:MAG: flavin reductase family protein, partial [Chloroflexi bacterium]|nr:flavin reductase family protein [Chloroflexota bacterium]